jgi:hypothetical protein
MVMKVPVILALSGAKRKDLQFRVRSELMQILRFAQIDRLPGSVARDVVGGS